MKIETTIDGLTIFLFAIGGFCLFMATIRTIIGSWPWEN
jgi:hypothetical protein